MTCLVATQQPWGRATYERVADARVGKESWVLRHAPPDDPEGSISLFSLCERVDPRYVFLLNWSSIVEPRVFERWECVNFHCTALPYGRGGHPIENLILAGHTETTMTAHRVEAELDAGPIYGRYAPISLAGDKEEILARFIAPIAAMIEAIVVLGPTPHPQAGQVVRFSRLSKTAYAEFWEQRRRTR